MTTDDHSENDGRDPGARDHEDTDRDDLPDGARDDQVDDVLDDSDDARIDRMARSAGRELRRPAPREGVVGVERAKRTRQVTRAVAGSTAVVLLVVGGLSVVALRDDADVGVTDTTPTVPTNSSVPPTSDPPPSVTPTSGPTSSLPSSTVPRATVSAVPDTADPTATLDRDPSPAGGTPGVVYTSPLSTTSGSDGDVQTLVDPVDGSSVGSEPIDVEVAREVWAASFAVSPRSTVEVGDVSYAFTEFPVDGDTDRFPDVDACRQNPVTVSNAGGSALPDRALLLRVTPDDRYVVTVSSDCPAPGPGDPNGPDVVDPTSYDAIVTVFDAARPERPGRILGMIPASDQPSTLTESGDGRFVSIDTFDDTASVRFFDLEAGTELDLQDDLGLVVGDGCGVVGTDLSRFVGPWLGESSIAVTVLCPSETGAATSAATTSIVDLADPDSRLELPTPSPGIRGDVEIDRATFTDPADAWFTLCDTADTTCWIGHGSDPLVELPGVAQASFLPLGFTPGG